MTRMIGMYGNANPKFHPLEVDKFAFQIKKFPFSIEEGKSLNLTGLSLKNKEVFLGKDYRDAYYGRVVRGEHFEEMKYE